MSIGGTPDGGYLSAEAFLRGILGESHDIEVEGLGTVRVRSLDTRTVQNIYAQAANDNLRMMTLAVLYGLEKPHLPEDAIEQLMTAKAGMIMVLGTRIMELSGMAATEELEKKAGNGS